ncbi:MAG: GtrA family protein [Clostridiales bacterium]|nr:GtrA family protein [Clostridiales bacterium]
MKEKIVQVFNKYKQFILFCIVGASNTLITLGVYTLLLQFNVPYIIASPIGYICGVFNGYLWSSKVVFKQKKTMDNATKFIIVNLFVLGVNTLLMWIWVDNLEIHEIWAQGLTICFTMPLNFILNKIWTYRSKSS